jgi:hypothetical protein
VGVKSAFGGQEGQTPLESRVSGLKVAKMRGQTTSSIVNGVGGSVRGTLDSLDDAGSRPTRLMKIIGNRHLARKSRSLNDFPTRWSAYPNATTGSRLRRSRGCLRLLDLTRRRLVVAWHPDSPT